MPRSLSEHLERADTIISIGGVRTLIPKKEPGAPIKCDASNLQLEYAATIRLVVTKYDSTGGVTVAYLRASEEAAPSMARAMEERVYHRVERDMRRMRKILRRGGIAVGRGR